MNAVRQDFKHKEILIMRQIEFLAVIFIITTAVWADWLEPENLGSVINSSSNDWYPVVAQDGSFMIFVSDQSGGFGQSDIWISYRIDEEWQIPQNMGANVNTIFVESAPYLAEGDSALYFASFAPGGYGQMDIYRALLIDGVPGIKQNMGPVINGSALDCCPLLSSDGNTFFMCSTRAGGMGSMDVWMSEKTGETWSTPVNMGINLNSNSTDCPRWISADGNTLIICSTRSGGLGGADMYYSVKEEDEWNPLTNFGSPVNSNSAEWGPGFISNNGMIAGTILFGSGRNGGYGGWDIWQSMQTSSISISDSQPLAFKLHECYPNPFNPSTTIAFNIIEASKVSIEVFNMKGQKVKTLVYEVLPAGEHSVIWNGMDSNGMKIGSGIYLYKLKAGDFHEVKKMILMK